MNSTQHDGFGAVVVAVVDTAGAFAKSVLKAVEVRVRVRLSQPLYKDKNPTKSAQGYVPRTTRMP